MTTPLFDPQKQQPPPGAGKPSTTSDQDRLAGAAVGGAILGASLAGPVGAVIGGLVGLVLGDSVNESKRKEGK